MSNIFQQHKPLPFANQVIDFPASCTLAEKKNAGARTDACFDADFAPLISDIEIKHLTPGIVLCVSGALNSRC